MNRNPFYMQFFCDYNYIFLTSNQVQMQKKKGQRKKERKKEKSDDKVQFVDS